MGKRKNTIKLIKEILDKDKAFESFPLSDFQKVELSIVDKKCPVGTLIEIHSRISGQDEVCIELLKRKNGMWTDIDKELDTLSNSRAEIKNETLKKSVKIFTKACEDYR